MKYLFGLLLLISIKSTSQSTNIKVLKNKKVIGENFLTHSEISAIVYSFPDNIYRSQIDTSSDLLTIQLRGLSKNGKWMKNNGKVVLYDLINNNVKWSRNINYNTTHLQQLNNTIIYIFSERSYCLNIENGENQWVVNDNIYFADPKYNIGFGYKYKSLGGYTNTLEGINLTKGNITWQKNIEREYGWNDILYLNDSIVLIVAAGLHAINIKNGTGWDYIAITGKKDYKETAAVNALGIAAGLLSGTYLIATGHNLVRDLISNVLIDSTDIYFASKEKLAKIDKENGNIIWSYPIPDNLTSKSSIFLKNNKIYMINYGYAFMGYKRLNFGTPFIACFDKTTGKQDFFSIIFKKKDPILGFRVQDDTISLAFKESISKYNMYNGSRIAEKNINIEKTGDLKYFVGNYVYIESNDSAFTSLLDVNPTNSYVFTTSGKTLMFNNQLQITDSLNYDRLYVHYLTTKNYKFIGKENETIVLNNENRKIARLNITRKNTMLIENTLYVIQENNILKIELSEINSN